jgi:hypothetical protein
MHPSCDNSVLIRVSAYFCTATFEELSNMQTGYFTIDSAISREVQSLFDNGETVGFLPGQYSTTLDRLEAADPESYRNIVNIMDTQVIPPNYYNEKHQFTKVHDIYCISGQVQTMYTSQELIDSHTTFEFMDIATWDTMRLSLTQSIADMEHGNQKLFDVSAAFHGAFTRYIAEGSYFVYDSDAKGVNMPGVNCVGGVIPMGKYYTPKFRSENITSSLLLFEASCHDLEQQYGHVRVNCYPGRIGEKLKIRFKDYTVPPIPQLGKANPEDGGESSIDKGYSINKTIEETVDGLIQQNMGMTDLGMTLDPNYMGYTPF